MPSSAPCLYLDSSIILAHVVGEQRKLIDKLRSDVTRHKLNCAVSTSVSEECERKIRELTDFLGNLIVDIVKDKVSQQRHVEKRPQTEPISAHDILAVERAFFEVLQYKAVEGRFARSNVLDLKSVEVFIVQAMDSALSSKQVPDLNQFLVSLNALVLRIIADYRAGLDAAITIKHELANIVSVSPAKGDVDKLKLLGLGEKDAVHVSSAAEAQNTKLCGKAVFVALDYNTIIIHQPEILSLLKIWCTDPLYAAYHALN